MLYAFKANVLAASQDAPNNPATAWLSQAAAKAACFLCLRILATRKRVNEFFETQLLCRYIFL